MRNLECVWATWRRQASAGLWSARAAWDRTPFGSIRFLLEIATRDERLREVRRILDDRRDGEPLAVRFDVAIEILRHHGVPARGNAVLAQVAWLHAGGDHFQAAVSRRRRAAADDPAAGYVPRRDRLPLPVRLAGRRRRAAESQHSRLL